jgi:hypothetical protein
MKFSRQVLKVTYPIVSTILKYWRYKLLRWMQYLHQYALLTSGFKFDNRCWATQESIVVKQWVSLLESIAEQQWDWRVPNDIVRIHC